MQYKDSRDELVKALDASIAKTASKYLLMRWKTPTQSDVIGRAVQRSSTSSRKNEVGIGKIADA